MNTPKTVPHTPTPWVAKENGGDDTNPAKMFIVDGSGNTIAACDYANDDATSEANAAHIVLCVNSHDRLLESAKQLFDLARIKWGNLDPDANKIFKSAEDVLAASQPTPDHE